MAATFQADFASFNSKSTQSVPTTAAVTSSPESYKFDEQKLHKLDSVEKQELFVFQWLSNLEKELKKGDKVKFYIIIIDNIIFNYYLYHNKNKIKK